MDSIQRAALCFLIFFTALAISVNPKDLVEAWALGLGIVISAMFFIFDVK
jgi:hypothetical protein